MPKWINSIRATSVLIVLITLTVALFMRIVEAKDYMVLASAIITAYFGKRDDKKSS